MSDTNPLLNNASVQGAAKSIEGILDPNTATIKPQEEATQVEPKEPEAKAEDTQEVQQQPEANQEEIQEAPVEEEAPVENDAIEEQETDTHQVKVNGEIIEVDLEELKAGYQKDADYRRKTEELALDKREAKSEKDRLAKQYSTKLDDLNSLVLTLNAEINNDMSSKELDQLWEEDPTEAAKVDRKIRRRRDTIAQAQRRLRDHQTQQFNEVVNEEKKRIYTKYPELSDPVKGSNLQRNMSNYLLTKGFNQSEVSAIYDSRQFDVIVDAMNYQNNKKLKPTLVNKKVKPSRVVKSGVKATKEEINSQSRLNKFKSLKKSGNAKDATDLLLRYI